MNRYKGITFKPWHLNVLLGDVSGVKPARVKYLTNILREKRIKPAKYLQKLKRWMGEVEDYDSNEMMIVPDVSNTASEIQVTEVSHMPDIPDETPEQEQETESEPYAVSLKWPIIIGLGGLAVYVTYKKLRKDIHNGKAPDPTPITTSQEPVSAPAQNDDDYQTY